MLLGYWIAWKLEMTQRVKDNFERDFWGTNDRKEAEQRTNN